MPPWHPVQVVLVSQKDCKKGALPSTFASKKEKRKEKRGNKKQALWTIVASDTAKCYGKQSKRHQLRLRWAKKKKMQNTSTRARVSDGLGVFCFFFFGAFSIRTPPWCSPFKELLLSAVFECSKTHFVRNKVTFGSLALVRVFFCLFLFCAAFLSLFFFLEQHGDHLL